MTEMSTNTTEFQFFSDDQQLKMMNFGHLNLFIDRSFDFDTIGLNKLEKSLLEKFNPDKSLAVLDANSVREKFNLAYTKEIKNSFIFIREIENGLDFTVLNKLVFTLNKFSAPENNNYIFLTTNSPYVFDVLKQHLANFYYLYLHNKSDKTISLIIERIFDETFLENLNQLYQTLYNLLEVKKASLFKKVEDKYQNRHEEFRIQKKQSVLQSIIDYYKLIKDFSKLQTKNLLMSCLNPNLNQIFFIHNELNKKYLIVEGYTDVQIFRFVNAKNYFDDVISSNGSVFFPFLLQVIKKQNNKSQILFLNDYDGNYSITETQRAFLSNHVKQNQLTNIEFITYKEIVDELDDYAKNKLQQKDAITIETFLKDILDTGPVSDEKRWIDKNELMVMLLTNNASNNKIMENLMNSLKNRAKPK